MSSLSCLPEEVQVDILLKLPEHSILSCKCVCKVWCSLLTNPKFIKTYLNHTIENSKNNPRFIMHTHIKSGRSRIYSVDHGTISSSAASATSSSFVYLEPAVQMDFPFEYNKQLSYMEIIGSCNGLVCLSISLSRDGVGMENTICLWNPLTREYKTIQLVTPNYFVNNGIQCTVKIGFGYHRNNDDYKVVRLRDYNSGSLRVDIYTLGLNLWTTIEFRNSYMFPPQKTGSGVLFNGVLHWSGFTSTQETCKRVIVSFDLSNERLLDFPLPEQVPHSMFDRDLSGNLIHGNQRVGVLGDKLCFSIHVSYFHSEVWVMQDYGVRESWTKLLRIRNTSIRPCFCLDNGEILMDSAAGLVLLDKAYEILRYVDVNSETYTHSKYGFLPGRSELQSFLYSLVSLDSGTYVEKKPTNGNTM